MTATARTLALAMVGLALVLPAELVRSQTRELAAPTREKLRETLAKIHEIQPKDPDAHGTHEFPDLDPVSRRLVREVRLGFQEVPAGRGDPGPILPCPPQPRRRRVRRDPLPDPAGRRGVRLPLGVRQPGQHRDPERQALEHPPRLRRRAGDRRVLDSPRRFEIPGVGLPAENFCVTQGLSGPLMPGTEYIFWFDLKNDQATPIFVKARLDPIGQVAPPRTPALQKAKGLHQTALGASDRKYDADLEGESGREVFRRPGEGGPRGQRQGRRGRGPSDRRRDRRDPSGRRRRPDPPRVPRDPGRLRGGHALDGRHQAGPRPGQGQRPEVRQRPQAVPARPGLSGSARAWSSSTRSTATWGRPSPGRTSRSSCPLPRRGTDPPVR